MIAVRKAHPALARGEMQPLPAASRSVLAHLRVHRGETILVVNNLAVALDPAAFSGQRPIGLFTGQAMAPVAGAPHRLEVPRYGYRWLSLRPQVGCTLQPIML